MTKYNPAEVEPKWQKIWEDTKLNVTREDSTKPKSYILDFFPYPSGSGLHVGHVRNYSISDAYPRFMRMQGYNVLHPMGWDAFGLPAENYAIKTGISPRQATDENKATYKRQMQLMGFSYDWTREIDSSDPNYYRWTQWFFKLLFEKKLAYRAEALVNWDPVDKTVLANEQIVNGRGERSGALVEKKPLKQWFFKITDYADRLLEGLDDINWPDGIKQQQRNWIGRSSGAEVDFTIYGSEENIRIFTTRVDTLFGATYIVLAPDHPLVTKLTTTEHKEQVAAYVKKTAAQTEVERQSADKAKTGVFIGAHAINPATNEKIPIWIADYVLMNYGTGAIMAVPAHDERDYEFAREFDLPVKIVIEPTTGVKQENPEHRKSIVALVRNPKTDKILSINWGSDNGGNILIGGGLEEGEDPKTAALREITEETGYKNLKLIAQSETIHHDYFAHSKNKARSIDVVGFYFELINEQKTEPKLEADEQGKFSVEWLSAGEADKKVQDELHHYLLQKFIFDKPYTGEGVLVNSGEYDGMDSFEAREKILAHLVSTQSAIEKINYRMHDWLISRQRYWGAPIPIIHCDKCGEVAVPDKDLPVVLPQLDDYKPSEDGKSPLSRVQEWVNTTCPDCGGAAKRETDTMDGFACSSWYFLRFADPHNNSSAFDPEKINHWLPVDMYIGGAEHAVMHLLYARFWTKVMYDTGLINFSEPFQTLRNQGMILAESGAKMSKRSGNVITPDDLIKQGYGADMIRMYELFIAPFDQTVPWSQEGLDGVRRFLNKAWDVVQSSSHNDTTQDTAEVDMQRRLHKVIQKVTKDLHEFKFNTAIAALMELVNYLYSVRDKNEISNDAWVQMKKNVALLFAPFAPHFSEEVWRMLGGLESVHAQDWPKYDAELVKDDFVTLIVQVNGKMRAQILVESGLTDEQVENQVREENESKDLTKGQDIKKVIIVPNRVVNLVT